MHRIDMDFGDMDDVGKLQLALFLAATTSEIVPHPSLVPHFVKFLYSEGERLITDMQKNGVMRIRFEDVSPCAEPAEYTPTEADKEQVRALYE